MTSLWLRAVVIAMALLITACGAQQSQSGTTSAPPSPSATPEAIASPSPSPDVTDRMRVPSLGIDVPLVYEDCTAVSSPTLPPAGSALFAVCHPPTFYGIVLANAAPFHALASATTAPGGTRVEVWDQSGFEKTWTLSGGVQTLPQLQDGSCPGHGVGAGSLTVQLRGGGSCVERSGAPI